MYEKIRQKLVAAKKQVSFKEKRPTTRDCFLAHDLLTAV